MTDTTPGVIGVYRTMSEAEAAVRHLTTKGFPIERISMIGQDLQSETQVHGFVTTGDVAKKGVKAGAWVGGIFGVLAGAALLVVPGVGPVLVLGPLAAGAVGAAEGATGGAGLGAVMGHFIAKRHVPKYVQHVQAGRYLLVVHGSNEDAARAQELLGATGAQDLARHDDALVPAALSAQ